MYNAVKSIFNLIAKAQNSLFFAVIFLNDLVSNSKTFLFTAILLKSAFPPFFFVWS